MRKFFTILAYVLILEHDARIQCLRPNAGTHCAHRETSKGFITCTCHELYFLNVPAVPYDCGELIISHCLLNQSDRYSFFNKYKNLKTVVFSSTTIQRQRDDAILEQLPNLDALAIINTTFRIDAKGFYWPPNLTSLTINRMNLTQFKIPARLKNLQTLNLDVNNLIKLPDVRNFAHIRTLSFNNNSELVLGYEDLVKLCNLAELNANSIPGSNRATTKSKAAYCNCVRLKYFLDKRVINHNIRGCFFRTAKRNFTETDCNLNFDLPGSNGTDPCGKEIIVYDGPVVKTRRVSLIRYFMLFVLIIVLSILISSTVLYCFRRKYKQTPQDQPTNTPPKSLSPLQPLSLPSPSLPSSITNRK